MTQSPASLLNRPHFQRIHLWRLATLLLVALLLIQPLRIGLNLFAIYVNFRQVVNELREVNRPTDASQVQPELATLAEELAWLDRNIAPLMPLLAHLEAVPRVGPLLSHADALVAAGHEAVALANQGITLVAESGRIDSTWAWPQLGSTLAPLAEEIAALKAQLALLPPTVMEGTLGAELAQFQAIVTLAALATEAGDAWPDLLGSTRPATYLIVVQNNHELRATGGFISAIAPATFVNGSLSPVEFVDSYAIYTDGLPYPPAPAPMRSFMGIELLTLRDGNWSPDFPSSAQVIRTLYRQHTGLDVDGIIAIDMDAVALALPAFGPLTLAGLEQPLTQANMEVTLVDMWNAPSATSASNDLQGDWWTQRKDFMGQLTQSLFAKLQQGDVNPAALALGIQQALDRRAVQIWFKQKQAQALVAAQGWDGGLQPVNDADFLAIVDTNMGYNKVNAVLQRAVDYRVTWPDDPSMGAEATLTLTYTHPIAISDPVCRAESYYGERYQDMMARCYFNYLRVYVPAGSELLETSGLIDATVTSLSAEQGTRQFAGYFVVNPNTRHQVRLRYRLPPALQQIDYRLIVQRQAGTDPLDLTLQSGDETNTVRLERGQLIWQPGAK